MTHVIGTAGHVDHGKSTLVTALTGIDPDRLAEEKAREMTIDLGFAWLTLPNGESVGVVDVPGHRDFIENMLAGIGGIDLAVFVIAADEGIMPQTREHLAILDLLEIPAGVIALTKIDMISDPGWLELVSADVREAVQGTFLQAAPLIPVSARTGDGLDRLVSAIQDGLAHTNPRPDRGRPRLPVDRVFTMSGFGTVVTGTLAEGALTIGEEVELVPSGRRARIRGLQTHKTSVEVAHPGSRVAINLTGVEKAEVKRGDVLARPGLLRGTTLIDVRFRHLSGMERPLRHNTQVKLFSGAAEAGSQVRLLGDQELAPGAEGWLQLRLEEPLALDKGDHFILRYPSPAETLGGGVILDPHPAHRWRRFKPEVLARLETLLGGSPEDKLLGVLDGLPAMAMADAFEQAGFSAEAAPKIVKEMTERGDLLNLGEGWLASQASWRRVVERMSGELSQYHLVNPLKAGMPREALRSRLELEHKVFNTVVGAASAQGSIVDGQHSIRLTSHIVQFNDLQQQAVAKLLAAVRADPVNTPSLKEAGSNVGEDVLQALFEQGSLVQVSPEVLFDAETYGRLVEQVKVTIAAHGSITVAQARDVFGTSRKYVLALLEHLDKVGVTRRTGDERVLR